jgi:hypothetical protein
VIDDRWFTAQTYANRTAFNIKVDETKLPQPGEIIKIRDEDGRVRLCQVESCRRVSSEDEWSTHYEVTLVLLPTGITFPMRASYEHWVLSPRATDLEGLAAADDS